VLLITVVTEETIRLKIVVLTRSSCFQTCFSIPPASFFHDARLLDKMLQLSAVCRRIAVNIARQDIADAEIRGDAMAAIAPER